MNKEELKSVINKEKENLETLKKEEASNSKKLKTSRSITLSSVALAFVLHTTGALLSLPVLVIVTLCFLLISVTTGAMFIFKQMDLEEDLKKKIELKKDLIKSYENDLQQELEKLPTTSINSNSMNVNKKDKSDKNQTKKR